MQEVPDDKKVSYKKVFLELFGTMGIVYTIIWCKIFSDLNRLNFTEIALAQGITYCVFTLLVQKISGAHFNPAITFSMAILKQITPNFAVMYILAQFMGALIATGFIFI